MITRWCGAVLGKWFGAYLAYSSLLSRGDTWGHSSQVAEVGCAVINGLPVLGILAKRMLS